MQDTVQMIIRENRKRLRKGILFCAAGILLNLLGAQLALALHLPLYLDNVGTILTGALGGYVPGIIAGYLTNLINGIKDHDTIYYGVLTVMIAVCAARFQRWGWFKKPLTLFLSVVIFALIGGGLGSLLTWTMYGMEFGQGIGGGLARWLHGACGFSPFWAQFCADFLLDIVDKAIVLGAAVLLIRAFPQSLKREVPLRLWKQAPLHGEARRTAQKVKTRGMSLGTKIMLLMSVIMVVIAFVTISISYAMFHQALIDAQVNMAHGVTHVVMNAFDPDQVDAFLREGEDAPGYREAEMAMASVRDSSPDIQYIYVYQIQPDGCHVVFDPDTAEEAGSDVGEIIPFDDAFQATLPALLAGEEIAPIISNETYGWLLTVYQPVQDASGRCACYVGVDISMRQIQIKEYSFLARASSLFVAFFILVLTVGYWLAKYCIVLPVNSMARALGGFAFDSDTSREEHLRTLESMCIHTGDEIENLYQAMTKTTEETVSYIEDVQKKNATISLMQDNLINVLADMVESRDQYTGNHVKNTAAYCEIIARQMRKEGVYTDQLTDEFIRNLIHSAPLHDVGKIHVSDMVLNKPGRLTDEEYSTMKHHTVAGREIIAKAAEKSQDKGYLAEAENLAAYHHERWDGKGYPYGLKGEEIPLSARIMAVADVFDAVVSKRSYKDGFPFDKCVAIIREGMGTHFDPKVGQAFLDAEEEVRRVAEENAKAQSAREHQP